jgi:hypothetical protein
MKALIISDTPMVFRSGLTERFGASVYVVDIPEEDVSMLAADPNVKGVYTEAILHSDMWYSLSGPELMGIANWNLRLACEQHRLLEGQVCGHF